MMPLEQKLKHWKQRRSDVHSMSPLWHQELKCHEKLNANYFPNIFRLHLGLAGAPDLVAGAFPVICLEVSGF
jgi:hypothetical protein